METITHERRQKWLPDGFGEKVTDFKVRYLENLTGKHEPNFNL